MKEHPASKQSKEATLPVEQLKVKIEEYQKLLAAIRFEVAKVVVGQQEALNTILRAIIADGHVLVEGVPGIAKTLLIRTIAKVTTCSFGRIQFTPDLLPSDIVGLSTYQEDKGFYTLKGPIFNNFILADEVNRAPPKVQSALLESMAEKQATISKETFPVPLPFFVLATQNPIENVGTYTLPEAQIDRFLFKLFMGYPSVEEEREVLHTNIQVSKFEDLGVNSIINQEKILEMQNVVKSIYVDEKIEKYVVRLVDATRYPKKFDIKLGMKYMQWGASPRASIGLFISGRAQALIEGKTFVTPDHIKKVALDVLRHRILLNYEGQAEGISTDDVVLELLHKVPIT